ncbi:MAG: type II toxin-antitoxin system VapC family toxin [Propionibacteriaceae bacterium]|nr:type II toxin-antitoxin system VapC family toxin [Propionibacteriaceae bacterium]
MIVLDANVLIGLYDAQDANHARAKELLLTHADEGFALSALTLTEFLIRPTALGRVTEAQDFITSMDIAVFPLLPTEAEYLATVRVTSGLKLPDVVVLGLAQSLPAAIMTMDERLVKAARAMSIEVV